MSKCAVAGCQARCSGQANTVPFFVCRLTLFLIVPSPPPAVVAAIVRILFLFTRRASAVFAVSLCIPHDSHLYHYILN